MTHLIDTDWLIDAMGGLPNAVQMLDSIGLDNVSVSIVTLGELFDGAFGYPDPSAQLAIFRDYLAGLTIVPLSDPIMETFARVRSRLRQQGTLIPDLDLLIAATAVTEGLVLVTRNRRHFRRIPGIVLHEQ